VSRVRRSLVVAALVVAGGGAVVTEVLNANGRHTPVPERSPVPARDGEVRLAVCDRRPVPVPSPNLIGFDPDPSKITVVLCPEDQHPDSP
jgi:hypothetical protein